MGGDEGERLHGLIAARWGRFAPVDPEGGYSALSDAAVEGWGEIAAALLAAQAARLAGLEAVAAAAERAVASWRRREACYLEFGWTDEGMAACGEWEDEADTGMTFLDAALARLGAGGEG